jgi:hypothetical protein
MKKGVVHMLEAVLVSLTFVMIVPFLLYPFVVRTDWDHIQMTLNGQDLLASLDKMDDGDDSFLQNIMDRNTSELENEIIKNFIWLENRKMNYGMESIGAIKNEIRVGFNCTGAGCWINNDAEAERRHIEKILRPAYINGRYVTFRVFPFSYDTIGRYKMDVLLIRGEIQGNDVNNNHLAEIDVLLDGGTGIVGFYNVTGTGTLETDYFGLADSVAGGGDIVFLNYDNASKPNYAIQKYFYGVGLNGNFTYKWLEHNSTQIILWGETYNVTRNDTDLNGDYEALDLDTDGDDVCDLFGKGENYYFTIDPPLGPPGYSFEIEKIDPRGRFFVLNFNRTTPYKFGNFFDALEVSVESDKGDSYDVVKYGDQSAVVVNGTDYTKWRGVWVSEGEGDDIYALVKSSVFWASDRSWWNILRSVSGEHMKISYLVSQGKEFHEPYWVELSLWYIY